MVLAENKTFDDRLNVPGEVETHRRPRKVRPHVPLTKTHYCVHNIAQHVSSMCESWIAHQHHGAMRRARRRSNNVMETLLTLIGKLQQLFGEGSSDYSIRFICC